MKTAISALAAATFLLSAQEGEASFLKRLINTAVQAATDKNGGSEEIVTEVLGQAIDAASRPRKRQKVEPVPAAAPEDGARVSPGPVPAPRPVVPSDIRPSEEIARSKRAFLAFGRYECSDCAGGQGDDASAGLILDPAGGTGFADKVGGLAVGASLQWQGRMSDGTLSVASEADVEGLRCKQVHYMLMRRSDHRLAERDGLFCFGPSGGDEAQQRWVEVY